MVIKEIDNGVCAPKGYKAAGIHCGIRKNKLKKDFALIVSETLASAAGVYTSNLVKGAPVIVTKSNLKDGKAQAVVCNSGNANTIMIKINLFNYDTHPTVANSYHLFFLQVRQVKFFL